MSILTVELKILSHTTSRKKENMENVDSLTSMDEII
jgi:hypothetical protein